MPNLPHSLSPSGTAPDSVRAAMMTVSTSLGDMELLSGHNLTQRFARHMHDTFAIGLVDTGANRVWHRGANHVVPRGSIVAISPGEMHTGEPVSDEGWSYRMIYPRPELVRLAADGLAPDDHAITFGNCVINDELLAARFASLHEVLSNWPAELEAEELLLEFLHTLIRRYAGIHRVTRRCHSPSARIVETAREYLHANYAQPVHLAPIAALCEVSPFHLIRAFRQQLQLPPLAYLRQLRVARAQEMIRAGETLVNVTYSCGFSDQSHLTRLFKSVIGVSPGVYQRAWKCGGAA